MGGLPSVSGSCELSWRVSLAAARSATWIQFLPLAWSSRLGIILVVLSHKVLQASLLSSRLSSSFARRLGLPLDPFSEVL